MVDKKIIVVLLSLILLTGCGIKKQDNNSYLKDFNNITYVEGKSAPATTTTTTTQTTTTTTVVPTTTVKTTKVTTKAATPKYEGPTTNDLKSEAELYIIKYKDKIDDMIRLINIERSKEGLAPLEYSYELSMAATVRSLEMHYTGVFEHTRQCPNNDANSSDCKKWSTVYNDLGIIYNRAAENIARGFVSTESCMNGFMNSPSHRKNIMNPNLKYVGIGVAEDGNAYYYTQEFKA